MSHFLHPLSESLLQSTEWDAHLPIIISEAHTWEREQGEQHLRTARLAQRRDLEQYWDVEINHGSKSSKLHKGSPPIFMPLGEFLQLGQIKGMISSLRPVSRLYDTLSGDSTLLRFDMTNWESRVKTAIAHSSDTTLTYEQKAGFGGPLMRFICQQCETLGYKDPSQRAALTFREVCNHQCSRVVPDNFTWDATLFKVDVMGSSVTKALDEEKSAEYYLCGSCGPSIVVPRLHMVSRCIDI